MPPAAKQNDWDIFCTVIDNYGDIGVCWRLARQLAEEHGYRIRLWVDELAAFHKICPEVDARLAVQNVGGVQVRRWIRNDSAFPGIIPGDVVIEAFACHLPEPFIAAMAKRCPPPVWINLDYLSAETWVSGCHALPSPHPRLPLTKYFFFPGFDETTGGLLREHDLDMRRQAFCASLEQQADFWRTLGLPRPAEDALLVSLFAYDNPAIADLLAAWAQGKASVCCLAPVTQTLPAMETFAGRPLRVGEYIHRGRLEIRILPFVAQPAYDRLLWSCDVNFVRGEDSFVRAQWAARPMVWHIYPQQESAHRVKLDAFLDLYCRGLSEASAETLRQFYLAWNGINDPGQITPALWARWCEALPALRKHARKWQKTRSKQEDLCSTLVRFSRSKL